MRTMARPAVPLVVLLAWLALPAVLPGRMPVLIIAALTVPLVVGVNLLAGYARQVSLGQAAFWGFGAYGTGVLTLHGGWSPWLAVPAAVVATAACAWLIGFPVLALRGQYLVIATLGFNIIFLVFVTQSTALTGGATGLIGIPPLGESALFTSDRFFFIAATVLAVASLLLGRRFVHSRQGRALQTIAGSETAAATLGISRRRLANQALVVSAVLAGASGGLYAEWMRFLSPDMFAVDTSVQLLVMAAVGGLASVWGAPVGVVAVVALQELLKQYVPGAASAEGAKYQLIAFGVLLGLVVIYRPRGLWPWLADLAARRRRPARPAGETGTPAASGDRPPSAIAWEGGGRRLEVRGLTRRFGGITAVEDVGFDVAPGEVYAVIGPNGAGKSTLLNLVSGVLSPTRGTVVLGGQVISGISAHRVSIAGVARSFQTPRLAPLLNVVDNVRAGAHHRLKSGLLRSLAGLSAREENDSVSAAKECLRAVNGRAPADAPVDALAFGDLRTTELARALMGHPHLLLLDEPASGLTTAERARLAETIRELSRHGVSIILVEHDVPLVMEVADRVLVLHHGRRIAEGTPAEVTADPAVVNAYLGAEKKVATVAKPTRETADNDVLLNVERLHAGYGGVHVLHDVSLRVRKGETVAIVGPNGAGKTTLLKAISGLIGAEGTVTFDGRPLLGTAPEEALRVGLALVPEHRQLLPSMTVRDHLELGAYVLSKSATRDAMDEVLRLFPVLREKSGQPARTLSGGQQQMLAIGRALMSRPRLLLLDEPLLGLAPLVIDDILRAILALKEHELGIILVEQNARTILPAVDRAYVLDTGRIQLEGKSDEFADNARLSAAFLGQPQL
jgi:ABC-type branched-subunit amino acid transport system ATPase component/ABC-type branched-subunit amino acid transport system permease subunit